MKLLVLVFVIQLVLKGQGYPMPADRDPETGAHFCSVTFKVISSSGRPRPYRLSSLKLLTRPPRQFASTARGLSVEHIPCLVYEVKLMPLDRTRRGVWRLEDGPIRKEIVLSGPRKVVIVLPANEIGPDGYGCYGDMVMRFRLLHLPRRWEGLWCELIARHGTAGHQQAPIDAEGVVTFSDRNNPGLYLLSIHSVRETIAVIPVTISDREGRRTDPIMDIDLAKYRSGPSVRYGKPVEEIEDMRLPTP